MRAVAPLGFKISIVYSEVLQYFSDLHFPVLLSVSPDFFFMFSSSHGFLSFLLYDFSPSFPSFPILLPLPAVIKQANILVFTDLPAGKLVEFLVGFTNNGDKDFILDAIDASFRYPMDFNFYIQNFTAIPYNRAVKPRQEATVMYSFYPAEAFAGRPLGLTVNLAYHDAVSLIWLFPWMI